MALTHSEQLQALSSIVPIADDTWQLFGRLSELGWTVPRTQVAFEESFGNDADRAQYRRIIVETRKIMLGSPNGRYGALGPRPRSEYLEKLRNEHVVKMRAQFGEGIPDWAQQADPCQRNLSKLRTERPEEFQILQADAEEAKLQARADEIRLHASDIRVADIQSSSDIEELYKATIGAAGRQHGFVLDVARSTPSRPIYTKKIFRDWSFCLSPEPLVWFPPKSAGEARVVLSLQNEVLFEPLRSLPLDRYLIIEYGELIHFFEFLYRRFQTMKELQVVLLARMQLLALVLDRLENRICAALKDLANSGDMELERF